ncbi:MAG: ribosome recycling factor [Gammaproteobacteria bacterium]|nr:ribosome recycling factor [Gammaproteobacteria bacterium]
MTVIDIKKDSETRMHKSVDALKAELSKLRTGRASTAILEHIKVAYYGNDVPLSQVANVAVADARTLTIQPWEKPMVAVIEKAILESNLGLNPMTAGNLIRVPVPALTEERRRDLTKVVKGTGEDAKIAIRNVRRDANQHLKNLLKEKQVTEDEERRAQDDVQKLTDRFVADVDKLLAAKEKELMEI